MKFKYLVAMVMLAAVTIIFSNVVIGQENKPEVNPVSVSAPSAVDSSFTYQGRLDDGSGPVNGNCDFRFSLWNAVSGGSQVGSNHTVSNVTVADGNFTAVVNDANQFGGNAFNGNNRWLKVEARCPTGSGSYTNLTPRQAITGAPYAYYANSANTANSAPWSGLTGTPRNDHDHYGQTWTYTSTYTTGLTIDTLGTSFYGRSLDINGIVGESYGAGLADYGVYGTTNSTSTSESGVYGLNSGNGPGVIGRSSQNNGVFGDALSTTDNTYGGYFTGQNSGVYGRGNNDYGGYIVSNNYRSLYAEGASGWFDGYFGGTLGIFVNGSCTGCTLTTIVQNNGSETLQMGDLVAISGVMPHYDPNATNPIITVSKLNANNSQAILGVVSAKFVTNLSSGESGRSELVYQEYADPETGDVDLIPVEQAVGDQSQEKSGYVTQESIEPGGFAVVVYSGMAQVKADATSGEIQAGDILLVSTTSDGVTSLRTVGQEKNDQSNIVGKALEPLSDKTGLLWVLVDLR